MEIILQRIAEFSAYFFMLILYIILILYKHQKSIIKTFRYYRFFCENDICSLRPKYRRFNVVLVHRHTNRDCFVQDLWTRNKVVLLLLNEVF